MIHRLFSSMSVLIITFSRTNIAAFLNYCIICPKRRVTVWLFAHPEIIPPHHFLSPQAALWLCLVIPVFVTRLFGIWVHESYRNFCRKTHFGLLITRFLWQEHNWWPVCAMGKQCVMTSWTLSARTWTPFPCPTVWVCVADCKYLQFTFLDLSEACRGDALR